MYLGLCWRQWHGWKLKQNIFFSLFRVFCTNWKGKKWKKRKKSGKIFLDAKNQRWKNIFGLPLMEKYFWMLKSYEKKIIWFLAESWDSEHFSKNFGKIFLDPKIFFHQTYLHLIYVLESGKCKYVWQVRLTEKYFWIQKYFSIRGGKTFLDYLWWKNIFGC